MKRKLLNLLMLLCISMQVFAHDFSVVNGDGKTIYYKITSSGKVAVTYQGAASVSYSNEYIGVINIPQNVTYNGNTYNVTSIGSEAFYECSGLTRVTMPNSVTNIGSRAFSECSALTSVTISNNVTSIGSYAFFRCIGLANITIPNSVLSIGDYAFYNCSGLTSITISNSVTSIGKQAFSSCSGLTSVTIGNSVRNIGSSAFSYCNGITNIIISNSVTSIDASAFAGCTGLTSVTIPNSVTSIGNYAFYDCSSLISITIPNSVTSIGTAPFYGCSSLTSISVEQGNTVYDSRNNSNAIIKTSTNKLIQGCKNTIIPNNVTSIGESAFSGCSGLISITIPNTVTSIGTAPFRGCSNLTSINVGQGNTVYDSRNNSNAIIETSTNKLIQGCKNTIIPNNVTSIGNYAFSGCSDLTRITIPNSVTSIGDYAFYDCSGLTSVTMLGVNPPSIESSTFPSTNTFLVPCGSWGNYSNAANWSSFGSRIQENCENVNNYMISILNGTTTQQTVPANMYYNYSVTQAIYHQSDINLSGEITSISWHPTGSSWGTRTWAVYLGETALDLFSSQSDLLTAEQLTEVYNGSVTTGADGWITIELSAPFTYSNESNLVIAVLDNTGSYTSSYPNYTSTSFTSGISYYTYRDASPYALTDASSARCSVPNIRLGITSEDEYCEAPSTISLASAEEESLTITWNALDAASGYVVQWKLPSETWENASEVFVSSNEVTISDLIANNVYDVRVQNGCGSAWISGSFPPSCDTIFELPWEETFESPEDVHSFVMTNQHATNTWVIGNATFNPGEEEATEGYSMYVSNNNGESFSSSSSPSYDDYQHSLATITVEFPEDELEYHIGFDFKVGGKHMYSSLYEGLKVYMVDGDVVVDGSIPEPRETVMDWQHDINDWTHFDAMLEGVAGTTKQFVFAYKVYASYYHNDMPAAVDNVSIYVDSSSICFNDINGIKYQKLTDSTVQVLSNGGNYSGDIVIPSTIETECGTFAVVGIGDSAFYNCWNLSSIQLPESITRIGKSAFARCDFSSITIPESVTYIGDSAFSSCINLTNITIPCNVDTIGRSAFQTGSNVNMLTYNAKNCVARNIFGEYGGGAQINSIVFGDSVRSIPNGLLANCLELTNVVIGNNVEEIGDSAFYSCHELTNITMGRSIKRIGSKAFNMCHSLTEITIPDSVIFIANDAFDLYDIQTINWNAVNYTSSTTPFDGPSMYGTLNVGVNVQRLPSAILSGCSVINFNAKNCTIDNNMYSSLYYLSEVNFGDSVQYIPASMLYGSNQITSITIPKYVIGIGENAFYGCNSLTTLNFNAIGCTNIGGYNSAFSNLTSLRQVNFGDSVFIIPPSMLSGCTGLTAVSIGANVESIGSEAFSGCTGLTTLYYNAKACTETDVFGYNSYDYSVHAFENLTNLRNVVFGDSVVMIPNYLLSGCSSIRQITIPSNVQMIGDYAFSRCSSLKNMWIGDSMYYIGNNAFSMTNLDTIKINTMLPPSLGTDVFTYSNMPINTTLVIPCGSKEYYQDSVGLSMGMMNEWLSFTNVQTANRYFEERNETICYDGLIFDSIPVTTSGTYSKNLLTDDGCDSTITLHVTVSPVYDTMITAEICQGERYLENNFAETLAGTYTQNLQTIDGCDSVVTLNLIVHPEKSLTIEGEICQGEVYEQYGFTANIAGTYTQRLQTMYGCDSIVSLNLRIHPTYDQTEYATIKQNGTYTFNGREYTQTGLYTDTLQTINGCDSICRLNLTVIDESFGEISHSICEGMSYEFNGQTLTTAGVYYDTITNMAGGDSILTLTLTINPVYNQTINASICQGDVYTENGFTANTIGTYTQNLQTINGCDSVVTLNLVVNTVYDTTINASICEGQRYIENNFIANTTGTYTQNLQTINGCDSVVRLNLIVNPVYDTTITASICFGETYSRHNFNETATGSYVQNLQTINGCDSIVRLNLQVNPVYDTIITASICQGETYVLNGFTETTAGTYVQNLQTINGCDSVVRLNLQVNPVYDTTIIASICQGETYTQYNFTENTTGTYVQNLQTINGCDSTIRLDLIVNRTYDTMIVASICEGETYSNYNFNETTTGTYVQNLQTINGCDSIVRLALILNPVYDTTINAVICQGETYSQYNFSETTAGSYVQNLQTTNGCDSTVRLNLQVNPVYDTTITASICQGEAYTLNGFNETTAGLYVQNLQTINGCDSVVRLNLQVNLVYDTTITASICQGEIYTLNGFNETTAGLYVQNLQTINGCDSIVRLNLQVNPVYDTTINAAICEGETYALNGFNETLTGLYVQNLQTTNGCDSIVRLNLQVNPVYDTTITASICQGETYALNGFNETLTGLYVQNLQTINGCDSIVRLNLQVNIVYDTTITAAICEGETYSQYNFNETTTGSYVQNLQTINGCDSIVRLNLQVNPVYDTTINAVICEGETYSQYNFTETTTGSYVQNLQTINGCDSTVRLNLQVNQVKTTNISAEICAGQMYEDNGFVASETGIYTQNLQTINGCDSIVILDLVVNPVYDTTITSFIHYGETYSQNNFTENETGVYTQNLQTINGCDSVVTLNLTVGRVYTNDVSNIELTSVTLSGSTDYPTAQMNDVITEGFVINNDTLFTSTISNTFIFTATDLDTFTTYQVKAFVQTSEGVYVGEEISFTTKAFVDDADTCYIYNENDLHRFAAAINGEDSSYARKYYKLMADITLDANTINNVTSIGIYPDKPFMGTFDGNNHIIYNVNIEKLNDSCQGLFSYTKGAGIYNLGIANINITSRKYTGGMIGYAENSYIQNCYVQGGNLYATTYSGGLMGYQTSGDNSVISNCYNTCTVQGNNYIGGLLGYSRGGVVRNSYVAAPIIGLGTTAIGAIIGGATEDMLTYNFYFSTETTEQTRAVGEISGSKSGEGRTDEEMKTVDFVALLNSGLPDVAWKMDYTNPINAGFPILVWQQGENALTSITSMDIKTKVYPNPTQDNTTLYLENINEDVKVILTDIQGRTLQTYTVKSGENSLSLNTSSLASGTYYVRIVGNTIQRTEKIIKK